MPGRIEVQPMMLSDAWDAINLWKKQFSFFCGGNAVYPCWENNTGSIEKYITGKSLAGATPLSREEMAIL